MTDSMPSFLGLLQAERGSPSPFFTGPKAKDYVENMPNFGNIYSPPEKEKSFLDKFIDKEYFQESLQEQLKENFKSYRPKDKSSQEKVFDFLSKMGGGDSGFEEVAAGLTISQPDTSARDAAILQANQAELQKEPSVARKAGSALLSAGLGALATKALSFIPFFCDVRVKDDIAPLQKSEVNDVLSECAFFVKDLNECS